MDCSIRDIFINNLFTFLTWGDGGGSGVRSSSRGEWDVSLVRYAKRHRDVVEVEIKNENGDKYRDGERWSRLQK